MQIDRGRFLDQGFLILRGLIPQERIARLRATYETVVGRQRLRWAADRGPDAPPGGEWDAGAQPRIYLEWPGLIDQATAEAAELWVDDEMLGIANRLLAVPEASGTEMMLMCSPTQRDHGPSSWHRDINAAHMAPLQRLIDDVVENGPRYVQWNIPLYDDDVLWVVPGSHRRSYGAREREWCPPGQVTRPLPDGIPVELRAGDAVVYINYILHWGSAYTRKLRRTIHGGHSCFTSHGAEPYLPFLSEHAQRHFARAELRTRRATAATELALRAVLHRDAGAYDAALEALQPGIGASGKLLLGIYLDKIADGIRHQHRADVPEAQWPARMIGTLHPITLRWGRRFAERFSRDEAEALAERFAAVDGRLRGETVDAEVHRQDGYLYEDVPDLADLVPV